MARHSGLLAMASFLGILCAAHAAQAQEPSPDPEPEAPSDDGVRVSVDDKPVIENWAWHGPMRDTGKLQLPADKTVEIAVEHFQIDGYAVLEFSLASAAAPVKSAGQ